MTVDGLLPGMTLEQIRRDKGEPTWSERTRDSVHHGWRLTPDGDVVTAAVDAGGTVTEVHGARLRSGADTLVNPGDTLEWLRSQFDVRKVDSLSTPSAGVISWPQRTGAVWLLRRDGLDYRFHVSDRQGLIAIVVRRSVD
jgi:hypothetical protein